MNQLTKSRVILWMNYKKNCRCCETCSAKKLGLGGWVAASRGILLIRSWPIAGKATACSQAFFTGTNTSCFWTESTCFPSSLTSYSLPTEAPRTKSFVICRVLWARPGRPLNFFPFPKAQIWKRFCFQTSSSLFVGFWHQGVVQGIVGGLIGEGHT